jgi:hypothetical protein
LFGCPAGSRRAAKEDGNSPVTDILRRYYKEGKEKRQEKIGIMQPSPEDVWQPKYACLEQAANCINL